VTPEETLQFYERALANGTRPVSVSGAHLAALLAESRALRELVEALPKCGRGFDCVRVATYIDERCSPVWGCDAHHREGDRELPTAAVTRRLGA
jgi:hypothetical protein